jgi:hypothetical protein
MTVPCFTEDQVRALALLAGGPLHQNAPEAAFMRGRASVPARTVKSLVGRGLISTTKGSAGSAARLSPRGQTLMGVSGPAELEI